MAKKWIKSEISYLNRYSTTKTLAELSQRFGTDTEEVRAKLVEMRVDSKDGAAGVIGPDPATEPFEEAVKALYRKSWKKAEGLFDKAIDISQSPDLTDRARQYVEVCRARQADEGEAPDPFVEAVYHKNRGDLDAAMDLVRKHGKAKEDRYVFLEASIHALADRAEEAVDSLNKAIELNSENRVHAFHDPDFAALRENPEFGHLFGLE